MPKVFRFVNNAAQREFKSLPEDIQLQFGADLNAISQDETPYSAVKNIGSSVGTGAIELIENGSPAYRCVYCVKYMDTLFILSAFTKTTNSVDRPAMSTASGRYQEMMRIVREAKAAAKKVANAAIPKASGKKNRRKR
tara:strand:+ start:1703 stop:2116 length:414 start_codon:yes stop_codon:yes gene_type:complete